MWAVMILCAGLRSLLLDRHILLILICVKQIQINITVINYNCFSVLVINHERFNLWFQCPEHTGPGKLPVIDICTRCGIPSNDSNFLNSTKAGVQDHHAHRWWLRLPGIIISFAPLPAPPQRNEHHHLSSSFVVVIIIIAVVVIVSWECEYSRLSSTITRFSIGIFPFPFVIEDSKLFPIATQPLQEGKGPRIGIDCKQLQDTPRPKVSDRCNANR